MPSADPARPQPSARTLDAALLRLHAACAEAESRAREDADLIERPQHLLALVRHRRDAVSLVESVLDVPHDRVRAKVRWKGHARLALTALRNAVVRSSDERMYGRQAALVERAIAACNDLLRMRLPDHTRASVERVHATLESDRRDLRLLARLE